MYYWGIPSLSFSFGASPHCHFVQGIPLLSLRLGHLPTVALFRAFLLLVTLFRASPYCRFVQDIPLPFSSFRASPYYRFCLGHPPIVSSPVGLLVQLLELVFGLASKVVIFQFSFQSQFFGLASRAVVFQFSFQSQFFWFGFQSYYFLSLSFRVSFFLFGFQSHYSSSLVFRVSFFV